MTCVSIYDNADGTVGLSSDYDENFLNEMKQNIPPSGRQWIKSDLSWVMDVEYYELLLELCKKHFDIVELYNSTGAMEFMYREGKLVTKKKKKK